MYLSSSYMKLYVHVCPGDIQSLILVPAKMQLVTMLFDGFV